MSFKKVTHVIFDLDGLLLDSPGYLLKFTVDLLTPYGVQTVQELPKNDSQGNLSRSTLYLDTETIYDSICYDVVARYGKKFTYDIDFKATTMGRKEIEIADMVVKHMDLPITGAELLKEVHKLFEERSSLVKFMPGAEKIVEHFFNHKIPIALATSSSAKSAEDKIKGNENFFSLFHHIVLGSSDPEVKRGKPHPDMFLTCASRFSDKPDPKDCLVFEDAPNGIEAALAAGMQTVMVPHPLLNRKHTEKASLVLESLKDLKPELFGLPPF